MLFRKRDRETAEQEPLPAQSEAEELAGGGRTVIGRSTRVVGKLYGDGPVIVRGDVKGSIEIRGGLSVRGGGRVEADVQANSIDLAGEARGRISAASRVSLTETGDFEGEMDTPILEVSPGSIVRGHARVAGLPIKDRRLFH